jgi:hypothetical protein
MNFTKIIHIKRICKFYNDDERYQHSTFISNSKLTIVSATWLQTYVCKSVLNGRIIQEQNLFNCTKWIKVILVTQGFASYKHYLLITFSIFCRKFPMNSADWSVEIQMCTVLVSKPGLIQ